MTTTQSQTAPETLCQQWHREFHWPWEETTYTLEGRWSSRTAEFSLCLPLDGEPAIVVKHIVRGTVIDPQDQVAGLRELARLRSETPVGARPPRVWAWSACPTALAVEHIPGTDVTELISVALENRRPEPLDPVLSVCGQTLALWHLRGAPPADQDQAASAMRRLRRCARRQGVNVGGAPAEGMTRLVHRYRDFGIYNFRLSTADEVVVLDPPSMAVDLDLPHRDLGWFLSTLQSSCATTAGDSPHRRYRQLVSRWRESFLGGYADGVRSEMSSWDQRAVSVFETAFLLARLRRLVRQRAVTRAWHFAGPVLCSRLRARR